MTHDGSVRFRTVSEQLRMIAAAVRHVCDAVDRREADSSAFDVAFENAIDAARNLWPLVEHDLRAMPPTLAPEFGGWLVVGRKLTDMAQGICDVNALSGIVYALDCAAARAEVRSPECVVGQAPSTVAALLGVKVDWVRKRMADRSLRRAPTAVELVEGRQVQRIALMPKDLDCAPNGLTFAEFWGLVVSFRRRCGHQPRRFRIARNTALWISGHVAEATEVAIVCAWHDAPPVSDSAEVTVWKTWFEYVDERLEGVAWACPLDQVDARQ